MGIKGELAKYAHRIVDSGLVVGAGGNLSMREGRTMYISPSGFDLKEIDDENWVEVDIPTGDVKGELKPSSELPLHLECFRAKEDIKAVLHAHPAYSIGVASAGKEIPPMFPDFPAMVKQVSYLDYMLPTTDAMAKAVGGVVADSEAVVLRNHGVLTIGKTMKEAFYYMQILEEAAKVYTVAKTVGEPRILNEEECNALKNLSAEAYRSELLQRKNN